MKEIIILAASVILGIFIFGMIADPGSGIYGQVGELWKSEISLRTVQDIAP